MSDQAGVKKRNPWLRGMLGAFAPVAIYILVVWVFFALTLLVVSMEVGDSSLSDNVVPLTCSVVLLTVGSGFQTPSLLLTIVPLLLTLGLVALTRDMVRRTSAKGKAYITGLLTWLFLTWVLSQNVALALIDPEWFILFKSGVVYTIGFAGAAIPGSGLLRSMMNTVHDAIPPRIRAMLKIGVLYPLLLLAFYLVVGMVVVIVWAVQSYPAMFKVFDLSSMGTGSRIATTLASLAWLPNLCLWALSWVTGGGFAVGSIAKFTLWVGSASGLPAVPVFALFPPAVGNGKLRLLLTTLPLAVGTLSALVLMIVPKWFGVRPGKAKDPVDAKSLVVQFLYPLGSFVMATVVLVLSLDVLFYIANGSLGRHRLKHVGVDVLQATQTIAKPTALGFFAAWLLAAVAVCSVLSVRFVARWLRRRREESLQNGASTPRSGLGSRMMGFIHGREAAQSATGNDESGTASKTDMGSAGQTQEHHRRRALQEADGSEGDGQRIEDL